MKAYAFKNGADVKVVGDYAYKSKNYDQKTNRGRYIKLYKARGNRVLISDNKKGIVTIMD